MTVSRDEDGKFTAYAWPGGYPVYHLCADGGTLCPPCANEHGSTEPDADDQWRIIASDVNWEDADLTCDHCNKPIEAAYSDEETE